MQLLAGSHIRCTGHVISHQGKGKQEHDQCGNADENNLALITKLLTQRGADILIGKAKQHSADNKTEQRNGLNTVPLFERSGGTEGHSHNGENKGLYHKQQQFSAAFLALDKQINHESQRNRRGSAHTESKHKAYRVCIKAAEVQPTLLAFRGRQSKAQSQQHAYARNAGIGIGGIENRKHTSADLDARKISIYAGVLLEEGKQRFGKETGRNKVNAEQCRQRSGKFNHGGYLACSAQFLTGEHNQ